MSYYCLRLSVHPSVRVSICPSVRPPVCPSVCHAPSTIYKNDAKSAASCRERAHQPREMAETSRGQTLTCTGLSFLIYTDRKPQIQKDFLGHPVHDPVEGKCLKLTQSTLLAGATVLFICGDSKPIDILPDADIINLPSSEGSHLNRSCKEVPEMPTGKLAPFAIWDSVDKSVLCYGGIDYITELRGCWKYTGDEWIDLRDILRRPRAASTAAKLSDGRYWITGGYRYELQNLCTVLVLSKRNVQI